MYISFVVQLKILNLYKNVAYVLVNNQLYVIKGALIGKPVIFASPQVTSLWTFVRLCLGLGRGWWFVELHYGIVLMLMLVLANKRSASLPKQSLSTRSHPQPDKANTLTRNRICAI